MYGQTRAGERVAKPLRDRGPKPGKLPPSMVRHARTAIAVGLHNTGHSGVQIAQVLNLSDRTIDRLLAEAAIDDDRYHRERRRFAGQVNDLEDDDDRRL